jgi:hypothetical protein
MVYEKSNKGKTGIEYDGIEEIDEGEEIERDDNTII